MLVEGVVVGPRFDAIVGDGVEDFTEDFGVGSGAGVPEGEEAVGEGVGDGGVLGGAKVVGIGHADGFGVCIGACAVLRR